LQRIGRVLHISSNRNMILKAESLPRIRDRVVDEKLKPVGTVFDIFGPVSSPYVSVKTEMDDLHRLVNRVLYSIPSPESRKMKRRRRK
jgi:rRNA processing protein Gar1